MSKQKTLRGQMGQKRRGYSVGERTFGYRSFPVGPVRNDKKGRPRPEGYKHQVEPLEAAIVLRVFQDFADGQPVLRIVRNLNGEGVAGRFRSSKGWSPSTISRMLANTKYIGHWIWNKKGTLREPHTNRSRSFDKPEREWVQNDDEALRIVPQPLWDAVQLRRQEVRQTWPGGKGRRGFSSQQGSRVKRFPPHLLSGTMDCGCCGGAIGLAGGKAGGYYGCLRAKRGACDNHVLVRRSLAEKLFLASVRQRLVEPSAIHYALRRVEQEVAKQYADTPQTIRRKTAELEAERRRLVKFVNYVAEGDSRAIRTVLQETERKVSRLEEELARIPQNSAKRMELPSVEWIEGRLFQVRTVLEARTEKSALLLRRLFGRIQLIPITPDTGRPYYEARSALDTLALVDEPDPDRGPEGGSKSLRWWRRRESNPRPKIQHRRNLHAYPPLIVSLPAWKGGGNRRKPSPD